eukprot:scaffold73842_cov60-Phaeocystis_antarctica.AAC.1
MGGCGSEAWLRSPNRGPMVGPAAAARPGQRRQSCGVPHAGALNQKLNHVPFKDDQLTMLLRPSLSGGAQTYVLLAARPEGEHATETLQALPLNCLPSCHLTILSSHHLIILPSYHHLTSCCRRCALARRVPPSRWQPGAAPSGRCRPHSPRSTSRWPSSSGPSVRRSVSRRMSCAAATSVRGCWTATAPAPPSLTSSSRRRRSPASSAPRRSARRSRSCSARGGRCSASEA